MEPNHPDSATAKPDDRERLVIFLADLKEAVNGMLKLYGFMLGELRAPAESAWHELDPTFKEVPAVLHSEQFDARQLASVGLTGVQLDFKLAGFNRALDQWNEHIQMTPRAPRWRRMLRLRGAKPVRQGLSISRRVLKWADVLLPSLASVVHLAEPIKEAKEAVEAALDDVIEGSAGVRDKHR